MNTDSILRLAIKSIEELTLGLDDRSYIDGVVTMALFTQAKEYEAQMAADFARSNELIIGARNERDAAVIATDRAVKERDEARRELDAMTAARDAAVARSEALAGELAALRTNGVTVTGAT